MRVLTEAALLFRPSRPLALAGLICLLIACSLMASPTIFYIQNRYVHEWMIYRFVVSNLLGFSSILLFCSAFLMKKIVSFSVPSYSETGRWWNYFERFFYGRFFWIAIAGMLFAGGALVFSSFIELVTTGATLEHWSRFIAMSFLFSAALILMITRLLDYCLELIIGDRK